MELLDRYLEAIRKHLPAKGRDDIVEELRANLLAEAEDMQEKLGRPLRREEEEALIKHHGRPVVVAARYSRQRYLIGPTMFTYYWLALRTAIGIAALVYSVVNGILFAVHNLQPSSIIPTILGFVGVAVNVAIWVTLVFVVLDFTRDRFGTKLDFMECWNPRDLPAVDTTPDRRMKAPIADFFLHLSFAIYLIIALRHPFLMFGPGVFFFENSMLKLAPVLYNFYWAFVVMAFAQATLHAIYIVARRLRPMRLYTDAIAKAFGLTILILAIRVHDFFLANPSATDPAAAQHTAQQLNMAIGMGLKVAAAVTVVVTAWKLFGWVTNRVRGGSSRSEMITGLIH